MCVQRDRRGRIGVIGSRGDVTINPRVLMGKEASVAGVMLPQQTPAERTEAAAYVVQKVMSGVVEPAVGEVFPLRAAPLAHAAAIDHKSRGKVVLDCRSETD